MPGRPRPVALFAAFIWIAASSTALAGQSAGASDRASGALTIFAGPDGSKQPQDLGINANMGLRVGVNWAGPIARTSGLGVQVGLGQNFSDAAVHVLDQVEGTSSRQQTFLTAGLFQRTKTFSWGVAFDTVIERYYDDVTLAQWRGRVAFDVRPADQLGIAFRAPARGADGNVATTAVRLDPIAQVAAFHRHTWDTHAQTTVWLGVASGHDNVVLVFPENTRSAPVAVYGAEIFVPLSGRFAIQGASNLILPAATGTVDAYLGVVWFPGRGAMQAATAAFAPMMAVANNPEFAVNLQRR
jgi:hypothetical protein